LNKLNQMVEVLNKEGLSDRLVRGSALRARANRLAHLDQHEAAYRDALEAVDLQRGLLGAKGSFVSSLHLAAIEAKHIGEDAQADALADEAEKLAGRLQLPHFQLAAQVAPLMNNFDPDLASRLLQEAKDAKNLEVFAAVRVIQATCDPALTDVERLRILEDTELTLAKARRGSSPEYVWLAIADLLAKKGEFKRAEKWYRKILADDPLNHRAGQNLVHCLWNLKEWQQAANYIRSILDVVGDKPGMLFAYGKSLLEAGDTSGAATALARAIGLADDQTPLKQNAIELLDQAARRGRPIPAATRPQVRIS
jgi:tetratricopeptide (TPR) repeat protein